MDVPSVLRHDLTVTRQTFGRGMVWDGEAPTAPGAGLQGGGEKTKPMEAAPAGVPGQPNSDQNGGNDTTGRVKGRRRRESDRLRSTATYDSNRIVDLPEDLQDWLKTGASGPHTGTMLGDFLVGSKLGEGGMGMVYRAIQLGLDRRVALKVLPRGLSQNPILVERFASESRAASLVLSPHVLQVYFAGSSGDDLFYAMEFVDGGDLGRLLSKHRAAGTRPTIREALGWIDQAARGLAAAADHGIVHRDIKPQNLIMTATGEVKIGDFGIAKIVGAETLTKAGHQLGTPHYASPEQSRGDVVDGRSDLYSLGVVFYELLTMRLPFEADNAQSLIYQHNYAEPVRPLVLVPELDPAIEAVCMRLLMKEPGQRYQRATDLAVDLERFIGGATVKVLPFNVAYGTGAKEAERRRLGRASRWPWIVLAAAVLIAVWVIHTWREHDSRNQEIERYRANLAVLDRSSPLPRSVVSDLESMRQLVGSDHGDVYRWSAKLARLEALRSNLSLLDRVELPPAAQRQNLERDLLLWISEVSTEDADAQRWSSRLAGIQATIADLEAQLSELDREPPSLAVSERLTPVLVNRLSLVGEDDKHRHWQGVLLETSTQVDDLRKRFAPLMERTPIIDVDLRAMRKELPVWYKLMGKDNEDGAVWEVEIQKRLAQISTMRIRMRWLDEIERVGVADLEKFEPYLATLLQHVSFQDATALAWQAKLRDARVRITDMQKVLARLDVASPLTRLEIATTGRVLAEYRPLAKPESPQLLAWEKRFAKEETEYAAAESLAKQLDARAPMPYGIVGAINRLAAGEQVLSPQLKQWREKVMRVKAIQQMLGPVDKLTSTPENRLLVDELAEKWVGEEDPLVKSARQRFAQMP